jgi:hypothetical protein
MALYTTPSPNAAFFPWTYGKGNNAPMMGLRGTSVESPPRPAEPWTGTYAGSSPGRITGFVMWVGNAVKGSVAWGGGIIGDGIRGVGNALGGGIAGVGGGVGKGLGSILTPVVISIVVILLALTLIVFVGGKTGGLRLSLRN